MEYSLDELTGTIGQWNNGSNNVIIGSHANPDFFNYRDLNIQ